MNFQPSGGFANPSNSHWTQERLHADVNRAVGGTLNLVRELSRISQTLDSRVHSDWIIKRVLFFSYELQTFVKPETPERERLAVLNQFFFKKKRFSCLAGPLRLTDASDALRIDRVLNERTGAASVIALIFAFLAERIGIQLEFVDLKPASFLKWCEFTEGEKPRPRYIDMTRSGAVLTDHELIETLHTRFHMLSICNASLLEPYAFESLLSDYILDLKKVLPAAADPEHLLFLQNTLISYQPSNLLLLGERAQLHRRIGNFKSALADLKRYFAFHEKAKSPAELVALFNELVQLLEPGKSGSELRD